MNKKVKNLKFTVAEVYEAGFMAAVMHYPNKLVKQNVSMTIDILCDDFIKNKIKDEIDLNKKLRNNPRHILCVPSNPHSDSGTGGLGFALGME